MIFKMGTSAIRNLLTGAIAGATLFVILKWPEMPEVSVVSAGAALGLTGYLWLLLFGGSLKIVYDMTLLAIFRHIRPPEESEGQSS